MRIRLICLLAASLLVMGLTGCSAEKPVTAGDSTTTPVATTAPTPGGPASGTSLAPGLYDQPDGTVVAIGTLEYRDLEGGFWAVVSRTGADSPEGTVVAVIANADEFAAQTAALKGLSVTVKGTRLHGASIRMAGPEIDATSIEERPDSGGPAE